MSDVVGIADSDKLSVQWVYDFMAIADGGFYYTTLESASEAVPLGDVNWMAASTGTASPLAQAKLSVAPCDKTTRRANHCGFSETRVKPVNQKYSA